MVQISPPPKKEDVKQKDRENKAVGARTFESVRGGGSKVLVGVKLEGQLPVRLLQIFVAGVFGNAEDFIKVLAILNPAISKQRRRLVGERRRSATRRRTPVGEAHLRTPCRCSSVKLFLSSAPAFPASLLPASSSRQPAGGGTWSAGGAAVPPPFLTMASISTADKDKGSEVNSGGTLTPQRVLVSVKSSCSARSVRPDRKHSFAFSTSRSASSLSILSTGADGLSRSLRRSQSGLRGVCVGIIWPELARLALVSDSCAQPLSPRSSFALSADVQTAAVGVALRKDRRHF
ncbi:hypothetical protein EYF80_060628 [Liparis tanakae]|uniref:Uncharacterized protein n=1 Tax=Liparis tanakae TaxID=230148 RepID=A0A4Z2EK86_9TELE|nr:hypothetical protein EYF80_060628 [Liparis tanakae]